MLGGSFNPAHDGHRSISLFAARALGLDEVWWLVSPGNPLKKTQTAFVDRLALLGVAAGLRDAQKGPALSAAVPTWTESWRVPSLHLQPCTCQGARTSSKVSSHWRS